MRKPLGRHHKQLRSKSDVALGAQRCNQASTTSAGSPVREAAVDPPLLYLSSWSMPEGVMQVVRSLEIWRILLSGPPPSAAATPCAQAGPARCSRRPSPWSGDAAVTTLNLKP
jgi:hypothetical protein